MTYRGHIERGSVVLDEAVVLPEGTKVRRRAACRIGGNAPERFNDVIGCISDLPSDMAENHDHYIHGTLKR